MSMLPTTPTIPINEILVLDRQRLNLKDIPTLAASIAEKGLIHPIVINQDKRLIAGGRRLAAHIHLNRTEVPFVYLETTSTDHLHELELEENVRREEMDWQERCLNVATVHKLKLQRAALESFKWGQQETAELLGLKSKASVHYTLEIATLLEKELKLPEEKRRYWKCEHMSEAWQLRLRDEEDALAASLATTTATQLTTQQEAKVDALTASLDDLITPSMVAPTVVFTEGRSADVIVHELHPEELYARAVEKIKSSGYKSLSLLEAQEVWGRSPKTNPAKSFETFHEDRLKMTEPWLNIPLSKMIHNLSCLEWMRTHPNSVDHIITDPPYAIEMSNLAQSNSGMVNVDTVADEHDVIENQSLLQNFIITSFNCLKDNGYCIFWMDITQWEMCYELACKVGYKVQRWPITWVKTHRCMNQAAQYNFTKTTEIAMVCRKGTATLTTPISECHISAPHDDFKVDLGHPFVKPFAVWEFLIKAVSFEGQTILEPFAGHGSGVLSLLRLKRRVIACELQENHFNILQENLKKEFLKINPNYNFV